MEFKKEIYKELRDEYKQLVLLDQKLWFYKFAVIGSVITIAVFHEDILGIEKQIGIDLTIYGFLALPAIALIIDLKGLEIGFHIKTISTFLEEHFEEVPQVSAWEQYKLNSTSFKKRNLINFISRVGTSILILIISFTIIGTLKSSWITFLILAGTILSLLPILVGSFFYSRLAKSTAKDT